MSEALSTRSRWSVAAIVMGAVAALVFDVAVDPAAPTRAQWWIVAVLLVTAVAGDLGSRLVRPRDSEMSPPWDVHTVWLLPAALLTPPLAWLPLLALSLGISSTRRGHRSVVRIVVGSITVLTTVAVHLLALVISPPLVAGLAGIGALYGIGIVIAVAVPHLFLSPSGAAVWLDHRWSLVQLACSFTGLLMGLAMIESPWAGLIGLAPLLLAAFALHWPELDRHARIDTKTGLPNARHWEDRSRYLIDAAAVQRVPVAVLMLDLDHFKQVNDTYGHLVGDEVLERLAGVLRSQTDHGDVVGRFGGEEFVITMFGLSAADAVAAAERIRRAVAAQDHHAISSQPLRSARTSPAEGTPTTEYDDTLAASPFRVTCTVGVCSSDAHGYELTALLAAADEALAAGKAGGRNRVELAAGPPENPSSAATGSR